MHFGQFLFASIVSTALTFRKELSAQRDYEPAAVLFPIGASQAKRAMYQKMLQAFDSDHYEDCISLAETLLRTFPNCPAPYMYRGQCYHILLRCEEAIADYKKALAADGKTESGTTYHLSRAAQFLHERITQCENTRILRDYIREEARNAALAALTSCEFRLATPPAVSEPPPSKKRAAKPTAKPRRRTVRNEPQDG